MGDSIVEVLVPEICVAVVLIGDESVLVDLVEGSVVVLVLLGSVVVGVVFVVEARVIEVAVAIVFVSDTSMFGGLVDESVVGKSDDVLADVGSSAVELMVDGMVLLEFASVTSVVDLVFADDVSVASDAAVCGNAVTVLAVGFVGVMEPATAVMFTDAVDVSSAVTFVSPAFVVSVLVAVGEKLVGTNGGSVALCTDVIAGSFEFLVVVDVIEEEDVAVTAIGGVFLGVVVAPEGGFVAPAGVKGEEELFTVLATVGTCRVASVVKPGEEGIGPIELLDVPLVIGEDGREVVDTVLVVGGC